MVFVVYIYLWYKSDKHLPDMVAILLKMHKTSPMFYIIIFYVICNLLNLNKNGLCCVHLSAV